MSIFRIYVDRHTTIANNGYSSLGESNNEAVILFAGGDGTGKNVFSRHLINLDLTELSDKISSSEINTAFTINYILKFKNSGPQAQELNSSIFSNSTNVIATSFDLIFFQVNKEFDSNLFGYDLDKALYITRQPGTFVLSGYANFLSATTLTSWDEPGVFANPTASTTYSTQHFQTTEDIEVDVTQIINNILSTGGTSANIGIAFAKPFEDMSGDTRMFANFFSDRTNSFFKPHIDVEYGQVINDDRMQMSNNRTGRLFLYLFSGNVATNYFSAGTVSINSNSNVPIITGLTPTQLSTGVYYVDILMTGTSKGQMFKDVWNGITFIPGVDQTNFTQNFVINANYYTSNQKSVNDYVIDVYGIDNNEIIQVGDLKRVYLKPRINYSNNAPFINPRIDYRLYCSLQEIIPWTQVNSTVLDGCPSSFFDIDTSWLLNSQTYQIQLRINELGTLRTLPDMLSFRIVNSINQIKLT